MVLALMTAPLGGIVVTYKLFKDERGKLLGQSLLTKMGVSVAGGTTTAIAILCLAMLTIEFNKILYKDHTYSSIALLLMTRAIKLSAITYVGAVFFILIGMFYSCLKRGCYLIKNQSDRTSLPSFNDGGG